MLEAATKTKRVLPAHAFKPGQIANPKGKPKGTQNRTTVLLKDAILLAAANVGRDEKGKDGLVGYLEKQAVVNPGPFMSLLGKVLPMVVQGDKNNPLQHRVFVELVAPGTAPKPLPPVEVLADEETGS